MDELNPNDPNVKGPNVDDTSEVDGAAAGEAQFFPAPPPPPSSPSFSASGSPSLGDTPVGGSAAAAPPPLETPGVGQPIAAAAPVQGMGGQTQGGQAQAPGWYPAPGGQRYWDGAQWTEHTAPSAAGAPPVAMGQTDERQMAMFAHLGQLLGLVSGIGGFVVPLVLMLTKGNESPYVRRAAVESLNFWITGILAMIVAFVTLLILVGFVLIPVVAIIWFVLPIYAGIKANEGVDYRYPFNLRLIS